MSAIHPHLTVLNVLSVRMTANATEASERAQQCVDDGNGTGAQAYFEAASVLGYLGKAYAEAAHDLAVAEQAKIDALDGARAIAEDSNGRANSKQG